MARKETKKIHASALVLGMVAKAENLAFDGGGFNCKLTIMVTVPGAGITVQRDLNMKTGAKFGTVSETAATHMTLVKLRSAEPMFEGVMMGQKVIAVYNPFSAVSARMATDPPEWEYSQVAVGQDAAVQYEGQWISVDGEILPEAPPGKRE